eukprot:CAMPEP_0206239978 /NCGR_PEP_ID=MMETSP0047_2-20121206/15684_1 /ASSEMBLY_ACC=CAM_ASM_000192 /TAXON_ID=195065 /ORGANISM="Chroomonas mesostigmatica_cf, Strain CCMP1168" /LENGTH=60 /DNA_ID=CAMNT_0053664711 /DNA_START=984 /DNA_END=1162 /DNA_ORIENTATION=-
MTPSFSPAPCIIVESESTGLVLTSPAFPPALIAPGAASILSARGVHGTGPCQADSVVCSG